MDKIEVTPAAGESVKIPDDNAPGRTIVIVGATMVRPTISVLRSYRRGDLKSDALDKRFGVSKPKPKPKPKPRKPKRTRDED